MNSLHSAMFPRGARRTADSHNAILTSFLAGGPDAIAQRLFSKWSVLRRQVRPDRMHCLIMGFDRAAHQNLFNMLRSGRTWSCEKPCDVSALADATRIDPGFTHLIVNLDAFHDLGAAVTHLVAFRKQRPQVVVILISENVIADDFGTERKCICDATLRAPVSRNRLSQAMAAANQNNAMAPHS